MNAFLTSITLPVLAILLRADPQTTESFAVGVYPKAHSSKLNVMVDNTRNKRLNLRLINPQNEIVYQEIVGKKRTKYRRYLDLGTLPDGVYQLQISDGQDTVVREISLNTHTPEPILPEKQISIR